ncbi:MAG: radical SAM protein [Muribaculaceae bacterium]|nr:radical SAM protein [Muribaculaceae bacterium]
MFISLANGYALRNDSNGSFIIKIDRTPDTADLQKGVLSIPPFFGKILSLLGTSEYPTNLQDISNETGLKANTIKYFLDQLIENPEAKGITVGNLMIVFPPFFLKKYDTPHTPTVFEEENFDWKQDLKINRPTVPANVNLMVTTKCTTDCQYCYAKRNLQPLLSTDELISIVRDLRSAGVVNLSLTGGDIFAHKGWQELLKVVREVKYNPFLSTKTPISKEDIQLLVDIGCTDMQFSLDAADSEILSRLIKVDNLYLEKVGKMLDACDKYGLKVGIRTVLTRINAEVEIMERLYDFITAHKAVCEWTVTPAFFSEYKEENYKDLEVDNEQLKALYSFFTSRESKIPVSMNKMDEKGYELKRCTTPEEYAEKNMICLANSTTTSILANGLCVVCEMTYEHPELILGDVRESSITDIWNSPKALRLYNFPKDELAKDSACSSCAVYTKCRAGFGKRICYMDIMKSGFRLDDPDPKCPMAPETDKIL